MLEPIYMISQSLAAVAVIITVGYLALQTRQNARVSEAELYHAVSQSWIGLFSSLQNAEFARLARVSLLHWDELSSNQKLVMHAFWSDILAHLDSILTLGQKGMIPKDQTVVWVNNALSILTTPGGRLWWESAKFLFGPQLRAALEARLAEPSSLPPPCTHFSPWEPNPLDLPLVLGDAKG